MMEAHPHDLVRDVPDRLPSVPLYRLPELHAALLEQLGFAQHAVIHRSIWSSLSECVRD